jgi:quercetin dioxygenase-like cupin family protein
MNLRELHDPGKGVSSVSAFKGGEGTVLSLQILKGHTLKEHVTKVPALLVCLEGKAVFENEHGLKVFLSPGDTVDIPPMVKHLVAAEEDSRFLLAK